MVQNDDGHGNVEGNMDGNVDVDVEMGGNGQQEVVEAAVQAEPSGTPTRGRTSRRKNHDVEYAPININELRLMQLKEDREAYHYDLQWCQDVLDHDDVTPAEKRSFQMRQLDLGHQLRAANHRIAEYEAEMQNHRFFGGPTSSSGRPSYMPAYNPRTSFMNAEPPQERRGPGRPPGSKNRPKDAGSTPQPPSSNAQKAAALASAGAKRTLPPTEIRVATRKSLDSLHCDSCRDCHRIFKTKLDAPVSITCALGHAFILTSRRLANGGTTENPRKRPRIEVGSPIGSTTEDDNEMNETTNTATVENARRSQEVDDEKDDAIKGTNARRAAHTRDTTKEDDRVQNGSGFTFVNNKKNINASSGGGPAAPSTPAHALPTRNTPASKTTGPATGAQTAAAAASGGAPTAGRDPTGPNGAMYQRLGHHMCQLCTSQKYLTQTTPKQPSEPSSWPLRDVSKMVTHYTRMHGEHNRMERCMELGRALEDNRGPFRYWLQETKRVKVTPDEVNMAIKELNEGHLPELLRRNSNAARAFPRD